MKKDKPYDKSVYQSLMLITQLSINMVVPIAMMCVLGVYLDMKLKTGWITVLLFFVGAIAGGQNVYRMMKRIYEENDTASKTRENDTAPKGKGTVDGYEIHGEPEKKK